MASQKFLDTLDMSLEDDETTDDEIFYQNDAVDCLKKVATTLSVEEVELKRSYTYDQNPIKEYREVNDYLVLKECNSALWYEIKALIGDFQGFSNSLCLYRSNDVLKLIAKIICKNDCYYLPENCFLEHERVTLTDFFKRSLHDHFNPQFDAIFSKGVSKVVKLEHASSGQPMMLKLAEDIGVNTNLEYDDNGMMKIDFEVLNENFWNDERPAFVKEQKKILDVMFTLLSLSSPSRESAELFATSMYSQEDSKLN